MPLPTTGKLYHAISVPESVTELVAAAQADTWGASDATAADSCDAAEAILLSPLLPSLLVALYRSRGHVEIDVPAIRANVEALAVELQRKRLTLARAQLSSSATAAGAAAVAPSLPPQLLLQAHNWVAAQLKSAQRLVKERLLLETQAHEAMMAVAVDALAGMRPFPAGGSSSDASGGGGQQAASGYKRAAGRRPAGDGADGPTAALAAAAAGAGVRGSRGGRARPFSHAIEDGHEEAGQEDEGSSGEEEEEGEEEGSNGRWRTRPRAAAAAGAGSDAAAALCKRVRDLPVDEDCREVSSEAL